MVSANTRACVADPQNIAQFSSSHSNKSTPNRKHQRLLRFYNFRDDKPSYRYSIVAHPARILALAFLCHLAFQTISAQAYAGTEVHGQSGAARALRGWRPDMATTSLRWGYNDAHVIDWSDHLGRRLLEDNSSNSRILAHRNDRIDPLNHFRKYRSGYNLKSKHYWASVIFTGIYGYAIAVVWLVLGLLLALVTCCRCLCGRRPNSKRPRSNFYYWAPRILVFLLSIVAIGSSVELYLANREFNIQANKVENTILGAAQSATNSIYNISSAISNVETLLEPYNVTALGTLAPLSEATVRSFIHSLNTTRVDLNTQAHNLQSKVDVNKKDYNLLIDAIEITLIVLTSVNLLLIVSGSASTFLRWRRFFYFVIVMGWILTALTWAMFGLFLTFHNVAADTCLALDEYLQDPTNTTLDSLLPCVDLSKDDITYKRARITIRSFITKENSTVALLQKLYGNSSTGLCDPLGGPPNYLYTGVCSIPGALPIGQAPQLIAPFVCQDDNVKQCTKTGYFVTKSANVQLVALSTAAQTLLDVFPEINGLINCSFVDNTFTTLVQERCPPAKSAINHIWITFALLSSAMVLVVVFWVLANHRNNEQQYLGAVLPQEEGHFPSPYTSIDKMRREGSEVM